MNDERIFIIILQMIANHMQPNSRAAAVAEAPPPFDATVSVVQNPSSAQDRCDIFKMNLKLCNI